ncbi:hypothetical protein [Psychrobacillus vulpis]|uniref:DUF5082 domain-containing protein n=1 Tax=Psychrobacillus vulpis TaxID=2325572 RepID=A0A544TW52_9BACI|nr:hypothetical protein [Psychrobacillus vulpis]TQR21677.1 hypothetical protein FG384_01600 [Psychrobacillus vulpis]
MIKTVKGKIIAGTLVITLASGAGVAFGASGAGENLKAWFDTQFNGAKADMENEITEYANGKKEDLKTEFNELKVGATTKINSSEETARTTANTNIDKELSQHLQSINTKKVEIEGYMNKQFEDIIVDAEQRIFDAGTEAARKASENMASHTDEVGQAAQTKLNTELTSTTDQALSDLRTAIENAKSSLQTQLDNQASSTTDEIKKLIDTRIGEVRVWVTMMTNFMVQEQEELIADRAQELEDAAKTAMQDLVDGI